MARLEAHLRDETVGNAPLAGLRTGAGDLWVQHDGLSVAPDDSAALYPVPSDHSGSVELPRLIVSVAATVFVIGAACGLTADSTAATFAATIGLSALILILVFLLDGFAADAFLSLGELTRAFACAGSIGAGLSLGMRRLWPGAISANAPLAVLAAFVLVGLVVERSAVANRRAASRRASALLLTESDRGEIDSEWQHCEDVEIIGRLTVPVEHRRFDATLAAHRPSLVLVTSGLNALDLELVRACSLFGARLLVLADPLLGLAARDPCVRLAGRPWVALHPLAIRSRHRRMKRAFDLALVLISMPVVMPLMMIVGGTVALSSHGGVLYRQIRLGEGGRPFVLYKFRSMYADAERETGPILARPDDPRVTALGRILRRTHLDELPQLWNVVRGDMSLVGPRPERPELAHGYKTVRDYPARTLLKPGLTGLAQLVAGYSASPPDKVRCDLLYLTSFSLRLDLRLIAATVLHLAKGLRNG